MIQSSFADYRIYSGGNAAKFNTKSRIRVDGVFGIDKVWEGNDVGLTLGLKYIVKSTFTRDNRMVFMMSDQGYTFDALFSVAYLEIPLMVMLPLTTNPLRFGFSMGASVALPLLDNSKSYNSTYFSFEDHPEYRYEREDYYREADEMGPNGGLFINAGFIAEYKNVYFECRYSHGMTRLGALKGVVMKEEKFRTMEILFGVHIILKKNHEIYPF